MFINYLSNILFIYTLKFEKCGAPQELKIEVPDIFGELGLSNGFDCFVIVEINGWTCATLFARDLWSRARKA